jgi:mRNA interferase MazF
MRQNALPEDAFPCSGRRGQIRTKAKTIDTNTKAVVCPKALDRLLLKTEANMKEIKRGEIYSADFGAGFGSEQGGVRPVLILQNNTGNKYSPTTIVAAITVRKSKAALPTHVAIMTSGLKTESTVLLEQIRTIDNGRLWVYSLTKALREQA